MSEQVYPPGESWFAQAQRDSGEWITYSPTNDRSKALDRVRINRAEHPGLKHRLVKETRIYTVDEEGSE